MRVLLVEDSKRLQTSIGAFLRDAGYAVDFAGDGEEGLWLAESGVHDVIVLDIMLPKLDGLSLLQQLRRKGLNTHVLLLTARDAVADRVHGLRSGADDYLVKPFASEELLARVQALCRRAYGAKQTRVVAGDLEIDTLAKEVTRAGQPVKLQPREYVLLEYLAARAGQVVSRAEIEAHIYDGDAEVMSNALESAVSSLRKKLGSAAAAGVANPQPLIHTRPGLGYMLKAGAR